MNIRAFEQHHPKLGSRIFIDPTALLIGQVEIGDDSSVWPMAVIRGDVHSIKVGERTSVQDGCILHVTHAGPYNVKGHDLNVGNDVTIGHKAIIHGCEIEDRCLIGMGAIIMDNAIVQSDVILGAGSLVPPNRKLEGGFLWVGSPAKKIRALTDKEKDYLKYSASNYVSLKDRHLAMPNLK